MNSIVSVIIDSREPDWVKGLRFGGVPTAVSPLDAGDFLIATSDNCLLGIERKQSDDLLNTLKQERLFPQMVKLRELTQWAYLLIHGPFYPGPDGKIITERQTGWEWAAIQGALLTIQEIGVNVVFAPTDLDVERTIIRLAARNREGPRVLPPRQPNVWGPGEAMLGALPGIGLEKIEALLEHCGTPAWALFHLVSDTEEHIPGIGPAIRAGVRRAIGLDDDLEFVILPRGILIGEKS
jgi:ERCC4-type nuclease